MPARKYPCSEFFVYVMRMPSGEPFYVGYGAAYRLRMIPDNPDVQRVVKELREAGQDFTRTTESFTIEEAAQTREMQLIAEYGRRADGGLLWNRTLTTRGGVHGRKLPEHHKAILLSHRLGKPLSEEHRKNVGDGVRGIKRSPETIERMKLAQKARWDKVRTERGRT